MKIIFTGNYKSLNDFESDDLDDFILITGKNGSGKTQLIRSLQLIFSKINEENEAKARFNISITPNPKLIQVGGFNRNISVANNKEIPKTLQDTADRFFSLINGNKQLYTLIYDNNISITDILKLNLDELRSKYGNESIESLLINMEEIVRRRNIPYVKNSDIFLNDLRHITAIDSNLITIISIIKDIKGKAIDEITHDDFFTTPIPEKLLDIPSLFESRVELIFQSYLRRRHENDYLFYRKTQYNAINYSIDDKEFSIKFPEPWKLINKILTKHDINLQIQEFSIEEYTDKTPLHVKFLKPLTAEALSFDQLSSGEKVIINLIILIFTKEFYSEDLKFPDLLLLDEPDAFLHPEMSKLLIEVLSESFVKELGIKVIMTTHSPATVALAPEESVYEMRNVPYCSLSKISKDAALVLLTGNLPTLSIDYKNHKQVFVESPTDRYYYQSLFDKLHERHSFRFKLYFISNQTGKGNSDWVGDIVSKLRLAGVQKAYGIIDWDLDKKNTDHTLVHGFGARYSIENYLYDAVYLAILFLQNNANNIRSAIGVDEHYQPYSLAEGNVERLQEIWQWLTSELIKRFPKISGGNNNDFEIEYLSGIKLKVPQWYLLIQGHELEEKLRTIFPSLAKYSGEGLLQKELTIIMVRCYPFIPKDSNDLLSVIAN